MHLQITLINLILAIPFGAFFGAYLASSIAGWLGINLGLIDIALEAPKSALLLFFSALLGVVAMDFFYYWFHRAMHMSPVLWQHHKMHHMDEEFDALTALRFNWVEFVIASFLMNIPAAILLKVQATSFVDVGLVNGSVLYILWLLRVINHTNLRIQFGHASFLWMSPQTHRIHHSKLVEHRDKNFAAHFPIWDVLFGTYCAPKKNEFPPTGVVGESEIQSLWESQAFTVREWWKMFLAWRLQRKTALGCERP